MTTLTRNPLVNSPKTSYFSHSLAPKEKDWSEALGSPSSLSSLDIRFSRLKDDLKSVAAEAINIGWDGYDALPIYQSTINYGIRFLSQLPPDLPDPDLAIDNDGDVAVEWRRPNRRMITIRISGDGTIVYAWRVGFIKQRGIEYFWQEIPGDVLNGIYRVVSGD